jgi:uncharacterized protein (DUF427 family)
LLLRRRIAISPVSAYILATFYFIGDCVQIFRNKKYLPMRSLCWRSAILPDMVERLPISLGQESVWDYPRPPRVEPVPQCVRIVFNGIEIVHSTAAFRVLETSHPPSYYIPPADIAMHYLTAGHGATTLCEWKGAATYFSLQVGDKHANHVAWAYAVPTPGFVQIKDHLAFYAGQMDACYVGAESVTAQPGGFYGGWITAGIIGPFKGVPGSSGW